MTREQTFKSLFPLEPAFRWKQIEKALFDPTITSIDQVTTLSKPMREILKKEFPWMTCQAVTLKTNAKGDTTKAVLQLHDGEKIESVLMSNARSEWTICISSQVGCAMGCKFCATGKMGLKRNLDSDEIIDQYRFWKTTHEASAECAPPLTKRQRSELPLPSSSPRISNIVVMGMGEPFANYENMKKALNTLLAQTDLGPTRITVSTVGLIPMLNQMLNDADWPHIRLAISLHSAISETRKSLIPTSYDTFLDDLTKWGHAYLKKLGNRRHHLTFEYVFLKGINDATKDAKALITLVHALGPENVRVNLIPYNFTGSIFQSGDNASILRFQSDLEKHGVTTTIRRSKGDDIEAACGQLIVIGK